MLCTLRPRLWEGPGADAAIGGPGGFSLWGEVSGVVGWEVCPPASRARRLLRISSALSSSIAFLLMVKGVTERSFCSLRPGREESGRCLSGCLVPRMGEVSELHSQRLKNKNTRGTEMPWRQSLQSPQRLLQLLIPEQPPLTATAAATGLS